MAGESRRRNQYPLHRAQDISSGDCTAAGQPINSWPLAVPAVVVNPPDNFWNDEATNLYLTDDNGENYELI
jgi:hypothetical protein